MGQLGDFLEAVYGSAERFNTIRASIRQWRNRDLADRASGGNRTVMGRRKVQACSATPPEEALLTVWIARPDRMRTESHHPNAEQEEAALAVVNGTEGWSRDQWGHVEIAGRLGPSSPGLSDVKRHFDNSRLRELFQALTLESTGNVRTAGCECVRVRAVHRPGGSLWPHWLPYGADEYEFHAHPERGVLLSIIARTGGQVFEVSEAIEVVFDELLDSSLFTYTPAVGEQVRPADTIVEHMTLEAAIRRMPFVVLVPTHLPDAKHSQVDIMYHPSRRRSPWAHLGLMYRGSEQYGSLWINESDTPDPDSSGLEWERVEQEGKPLWISDPGEEGMRVVAFEQQGTHVKIWSDLDRSQLLDLALSLVPAGLTYPLYLR
jgi:hypothetical protein